MSRTKKMLNRLGALAGLLTLSLCATAFDSDATISIDRALNSPTLTVHYTGASAALAELRLNGESFGTRVLNPASLSGETNFTLGMSVLNQGENAIEIRLFDKDGLLVGTQRTTIFAEKKPSDVSLSSPKAGQTLLGPVEIKVSFGKELKNPYVSFFVDNQFKLMTNFAPYTYLWDTVREVNGWHEVEAWVVDDTSATLKTKKVRIFVNNPSGRTNRIFSTIRPEVATFKPVNLATSANPGISVEPVGDSAIRPNAELGSAESAGATGGAAAPNLHPEPIPNPVSSPVTAAMSSLRLALPLYSIPTGVRNLTPTGTRVAFQPVGQPSANPVKAIPTGEGSGLKLTSNPASTTVSASPRPTTPKPITVASIKVSQPRVTPIAQPNRVVTEARATIKPSTSTPTPKLVVTTPSDAAPKIVPVTKTVTTVVKVEPGVKIPYKGSYAVVMDGKLVEFDVQPRVDEGVPMTPFRHLVEKRGGTVDWDGHTQSVTASADGRAIYLQIGTKVARIDNATVQMELAPYLEKGRTIVPLSFMRETLHVNIEYDKATNHVLITSVKS